MQRVMIQKRTKINSKHISGWYYAIGKKMPLETYRIPLFENKFDRVINHKNIFHKTKLGLTISSVGQKYSHARLVLCSIYLYPSWNKSFCKRWDIFKTALYLTKTIHESKQSAVTWANFCFTFEHRTREK